MKILFVSLLFWSQAFATPLQFSVISLDDSLVKDNFSTLFLTVNGATCAEIKSWHRPLPTCLKVILERELSEKTKCTKAITVKPTTVGNFTITNLYAETQTSKTNTQSVSIRVTEKASEKKPPTDKLKFENDDIASWYKQMVTFYSVWLDYELKEKDGFKLYCKPKDLDFIRLFTDKEEDDFETYYNFYDTCNMEGNVTHSQLKVNPITLHLKSLSEFNLIQGTFLQIRSKDDSGYFSEILSLQGVTKKERKITARFIMIYSAEVGINFAQQTLRTRSHAGKIVLQEFMGKAINRGLPF